MKRTLPCALLLLLSACMTGPDYRRPAVETPPAFAGASHWKTAVPADTLDRGPWWHLFGDANLDALEQELARSSPSLAVAKAQLDQALATLAAARAVLYPALSAAPSATRSRDSQNLSARGNAPGAVTSDFNLPLQASWELDLFGGARRALEATQASAQASAGDLAATRLSLQATLAMDYFQLLGVDEQNRILDATVVAYERSLKLTENRYRAGVAARSDVVQAQTQLDTARAQRADLDIQRAQLAHAVAVLAGRPPAALAVAEGRLPQQLPGLPAVLPSQLLERRPDIAAAERRMAAANAQIGVARAAFFPTISLSASAGLESAVLGNWLSLPSRFWAVGPSMLQSVFDGGLRRAQSQQAVAAYEATVATYRQVVLGAFQDTEDNLAALEALAREAQFQEAGVQHARESLQLVTNQYKAGTLSYLDVVTAQTIALAAERNLADIQSRRLTAAVLLIKAIGGGWHPPAAGA